MTFASVHLKIQPERMAGFRKRIGVMLAACLALLVFSGDVLDDVPQFSGQLVALDGSHSSGQQHSGTTKCSHHDIAALMGAPPFVTPELPIAFFYSDVDDVVAPGAPPSIDHPPQLA